MCIKDESLNLSIIKFADIEDLNEIKPETQ